MTDSPVKQVASFIDRFDPEIAKLVGIIDEVPENRELKIFDYGSGHRDMLASNEEVVHSYSAIRSQDVRIVVKQIAHLFLVCLCASFPLAAQSSPTAPEAGLRYPETSGRDERTRRPLARRSVWVNEYQPNSIEKKLLTPSVEDEQRFAQFLHLPGTGMIRMFPPGRRRVVSLADLESGRRPGFGSHAGMYSFSKEKHGNGLQGYVDPRLGWAELRLLNGRFVTGFTGESLGVMVALGDVPLETVTAETFGVTGLAKIIPPSDYLEAASLSRRNRGGFELERFRYGSSLPAAANTTYVLRSTSNKRGDLLVGFRVIRLDEAGGLTLIWRRLRIYPTPSWKRRLQ